MRVSCLSPLGAALLLAALFVWSGTRLSPVAPEERIYLERTADRVIRGESEAAEREAWTARAGAYLDLVSGASRSGAVAGETGGAGADTVEASGRFAELAVAVERIAEGDGGRIAAFTLEREGETIHLRLIRGGIEGEGR
ncbi:MAG: hypothetical protein JW958_10210 [Candidatus Eisenbacteria bacterium]|nr:hypothetical protein [Candidatus Eisenbacteria bacterium]